MTNSPTAELDRAEAPPASANEAWRRIAALRPRLAAIGAVLVAIALLTSFLLALQDRQAALDSGRAAADNLALSLAEQTASAIQAVDIVLLDLQMHATETRPNSAASVSQMLAGPVFASWLASSVAHLRQLETLLLADAQGRVLSAAGPMPQAGQEAAAATAARHFAANPGDALFIGAPLPEPESAPGQVCWLVYLARAVTLADGTPAGFVVASLRLDAFGSLFAGLHLPDEGMAALLRRDGTLLMRQPPAPQTGMRLPPGDPWFKSVARGGGNFRVRSIFDGRERLVSLQLVRDYQLVTVVGLDEATVLERWQREAAIAALGALAACSCILLMLRVLLRQIRQLEQSQASLEAANLSLSRKSRELETTLAFMDQGLIMVDADRTVAVCNQRAIDMLNLSPELMASRPSFEQVLATHVDSEEFRDAASDPQALISAFGVMDRPQTYERRRPNGRVVEVRSVPLAGGGMVRTYTDITARTLGEERFPPDFQ